MTPSGASEEESLGEHEAWFKIICLSSSCKPWIRAQGEYPNLCRVMAGGLPCALEEDTESLSLPQFLRL